MGTCYFKKKGKCVLNKSICCLCNHKIEEIDGISDMKDYVNIVTIKNNSRKTYFISILALIISFVTLILKIFEA